MRLRIIQALGLLCLSGGLAFGQTLTLSSAPNPSTVGQTVTLTLNPNDVTVSGTEITGSNVIVVSSTAGLNIGMYEAGTFITIININGNSVTLSQNSTSTGAASFTFTFLPPNTTLTFHDGGSSSGPVIGSTTSSSSGGPVNIGVSSLSVGAHQLIACYQIVSNPQTCSNIVAQQVNPPPPPTLTLTSTPNPSIAFQTVTLTASPVGSFTTVTFYDGGVNGTVLNTASSGNAFTVSTQVSFTTAGTHQLVACYPSDVQSGRVCSNTVSQQVNTIPTSLTFTSSPNPSSPCQPVTLTATVSANGSTATVTGSVTFSDGTTTLAANVPLSGGSASFTVSSFTPGNHLLQARYNPDPAYGGSSSTIAQTVSGSATATLNSSPNPSNLNQTVVMTVTVAAVPCQGTTPPAPTGTVTFFDGTTQINQSSLVSGTATFSTPALTAGNHSLNARYNGDGNYAAVNSNTVTQVVTNQKTNTATALSASPLTLSTTGTLTLTAQVTAQGSTSQSPTGQVQFIEDGSPVGVSGSLPTNGIVTFQQANLSAGTHSFTATYPGDGNFNASTSSPPVTVTVTPPPTTLTLSCNPATGPTTAGVAYTTTCTASGGTAPYSFVNPPAGLPAGLNLTQTGANTATISGAPSQAGPYSFAVTVQDSSSPRQNATAPFSGTIGPAPTSLTLSCNPATGPTTQGVAYATTCTASGGTAPYSFVNPPAGLPAGLGLTQTGANTATVSGSPSQTGPYSFVVTVQDSSSPRQIATAPFSGTIGTAPPTPTSINLTAGPSSVNSGTPVIMSAVVTPATATGTVTFMDNGSAIPGGAVQLTNGTAGLQTTALAVGTHRLVAVYNGNSTFGPSTSNPVDVVVNGPSTRTNLVSVTPNPATFGQMVGFSASVTPVSGNGTPTGTVTFTEAGQTVASGQLNNGIATGQTSTLSVGTHLIVASYSGDSTFNSSDSVPPTSVQVNKAVTTTVLTPTPSSSTPGQTVQLSAKVTSTASGTITGTVTFMNGAAAIGSPVQVTGGVATTTTQFPSKGTFTLTAVYSGDANFAASTSTPPTSFTVSTTALTATTTTLAPPAPATFGQSLTLTATVAAAGATGTITGTVTFMEGGTVLGSGPVNNGTATAQTSSLTAGTHMLVAAYGGDPTFAPSTSQAVTATVSKANSTTVISPTTPSATGNVTLTATVTPSAATGTVAFIEGGKTLGSPSLVNGAATFAATFAPGSHSLTASYSGDNNANPSTSPAVVQVVGTPLSNVLPTTLPEAIVGVPYSQPFTATGGTPPLTWSMPTGSVPGLTLDPQSGILAGMPTTAGTTTLGIRVTDSTGAAIGTGPVLTVIARPSVSITAVTLQATGGAPQVTASYSLPLTATFTLSFTPNAANLSATYVNPDVVFIGGKTTSAPVSIPANSTGPISFDQFQLGSVAGTITLSLASLTPSPGVPNAGQSLLPASPVTTTLLVARSAPVIVPGSVQIKSIMPASFSVVLDATSNTRDLLSANVTFTPATGDVLNPTQFTVPLTAATTAWFPGADGVANGGRFFLSMPFTYSGDTNALGTVSVTLTNSAGTSPNVTGGR